MDPAEVELALGAHYAPSAMMRGERMPFLKGKDEEAAQGAWSELEGKSLGLRHPYLTGIPTLGIWPSISRANALDEMPRLMDKRSPGYISVLQKLEEAAQKKYLKEQEVQHQRDKDLIPVRQEEEKTRRHQALANAAASAALGLGSMAADAYKSTDTEDEGEE